MVEKPFSLSTYQHNIIQGRITGSRCLKCTKSFLPPRPICDLCQESKMELTNLKTTGVIVGFTVVCVPGPDLAAKGYRRDNPYVAALIRLDDGPCIPARVIPHDLDSPNAGIDIGMQVCADFVHDNNRGQKTVSVVFKVAQSQA